MLRNGCLPHQVLSSPLSLNLRDKVVYVRRSIQRERSILNDEALIARLSEVVAEVGQGLLHFVTLDDAAPALPIAQQIAIFQRARVVVGPNGEGLTNVVFCGEGSTLLEFAAGGIEGQTSFLVRPTGYVPPCTTHT